MPWVDAFDRETASRFPELEILQEESMAAHTTFRIGGPARRFARPRSPEELTALLELAGERRWPVLLVGNGSNLLVSDRGLDRLVIHTGAVERIARTGETVLRAGAGTGLACLASFALREGLTGLEFAHGIPGSLGGAVCMNAGAYGGEMAQVLEETPTESNLRLTVRMPGAAPRRLCQAVNRRLEEGWQLRLETQRRERELKYTMACISHDIRTPLAGAMGYLQLLEGEPERQVEYLGIVKKRLGELEELLEGEGACRVHGGGFAGTIQAFVPLPRLAAFRAGMEAVAGRGSCHVLSIRDTGSVLLVS